MFLLEDSLSVHHMLRPFLKHFFLLKAGAGIAFVLCLALNLSVSLTLQVHAQTQILSSGPAGQVVKTPQVKATLLALAPDGIGPGKTLWLGLELVHQAHWHTYWRNPGDSGLPTELQWKLPTGLAAGPIVWPAPRRIPIGSLANYGYEDTTLLVTPIQIGPSFKPQNNESSIQIDLRANWLVANRSAFHKRAISASSCPYRARLPWRAMRLTKHFNCKPKPCLANTKHALRQMVALCN